MAHLHRFLVPADTARTGEVALPEEEAHHAARVVRVRTGDAVALFDGQGGEWKGQVASVDRTRVSVAVSAFAQTAPAAFRVHLVVGMPQRPAAVEQIIVQGTALGVQAFTFFTAERSGKPATQSEKWVRWAIESCKQCGRSRVPEVQAAGALAEAWPEGGPVLLARQGEPHVPLSTAHAGANAVNLLVGPEGDFTPAEYAWADERGAVAISLGAHTLRTEVAAITAAALALYEGGALGPR